MGRSVLTIPNQEEQTQGTYSYKLFTSSAPTSFSICLKSPHAEHPKAREGLMRSQYLLLDQILLFGIFLLDQ